MKIFSYTHGTAKTEQEFVSVVDTFLTSTIGGWTLIEKVSDTTSDRDYAWRSAGEDLNRGTVFIRMRGYSDKIYHYGYGSYGNSSSYGHQLYEASNTYVDVSGYGFKYWLFGDKNFICYIVRNSSNRRSYQGYLGFIRSYYIPETDRVPLLIRGQTEAGNSWSGPVTTQNYMHLPVSSGQYAYKGYNYYTDYTVCEHALRDSTINLVPVPLYSDSVGSYEVRGEPYGVFNVAGHKVGDCGHVATSSGIFLTFINNYDATQAFAYGPVAEYQESFSDY